MIKPYPTHFCSCCINQNCMVLMKKILIMDIGLMSFNCNPHLHNDGLVQERCNSIANALELRLSCTNPSICPLVILMYNCNSMAKDLYPWFLVHISTEIYFHKWFHIFPSMLNDRLLVNCFHSPNCLQKLAELKRAYKWLCFCNGLDPW